MTFCLCIGLFLLVFFPRSPRLTLSVTISAFFRIEAWLSPRMRLSSPDHSPLIARTRVLAICSFCRFSSYNTASGRFYQPGETFMTHLIYSGLCCFFFFFFSFFKSIDERYIKAPIAASKCRPTTSEVAWVFSGRYIMPPCRPPTGSKLRNVQVLLTFLMCVNLQHFVTERDIATPD